ncbi:MAG: DNA adenine methylase [Candidatus Portiera sp.]|nr:DNA adenine methylase [Portiera sp.]
MTVCKPVLKWVGGKRQLISDIQKNLPSNYNSYFEPFIGGGALFFHLKKTGCHINDFNEDLVNVYEVVKKQPHKLIASLKEHKNTEEHYYETRALDRNSEFSKMSAVEKASRFIFLNRTGFNGLYRVNRSGQNNVPFGKYENPQIVNADNILACSKLLKETIITNGDFENIKGSIKKGDLVYFDPPYIPISKTSSFTSYTSEGFSTNEQQRLRIFCDYIDSIGAYFLLSNSSAEEVKVLYDGYRIQKVTANRAINCKSNGRGKVGELLIMNYEPSPADLLADGG